MTSEEVTRPFNKNGLKNYEWISADDDGENKDIQVKGETYRHHDKANDRTVLITNLRCFRLEDAAAIYDLFKDREVIDASELNEFGVSISRITREGVIPPIPGPNSTVNIEFGLRERTKEGHEGEMKIYPVALTMKTKKASFKMTLEELQEYAAGKVQANSKSEEVFEGEKPSKTTAKKLEVNVSEAAELLGKA